MLISTCKCVENITDAFEVYMTASNLDFCCEGYSIERYFGTGNIHSLHEDLTRSLLERYQYGTFNKLSYLIRKKIGKK